jgi:hypothetical protein
MISFREAVQEIIEASTHKPALEKVGWYGDGDKHGSRMEMIKIGAQHKDIFDLHDVRPRQTAIGVMQDELTDNYISLSDLVKKYAYLIDITGGGYSGRLKYLMFSKRPILICERTYHEYFHEDLIPYYHYIPVHQNLSNLEHQARWVRHHKVEAAEIALNAYNFAIANFTLLKLCERVKFVYDNVHADLAIKNSN